MAKIGNINTEFFKKSSGSLSERLADIAQETLDEGGYNIQLNIPDIKSDIDSKKILPQQNPFDPPNTFVV